MSRGKHEEAAEVKAPGCLSIAVLNVSVSKWSSGNHQVCCACCPSKPKSSNCFIVTLQTEIDQGFIFFTDRLQVDDVHC